MADAVAAGKPVVAVNQGRTRADAVLTRKVEHEVGEALQAMAAAAQMRETRRL